MAQSTDKTLKQLIINQMPRSVYNAKKAAGELDPEQVYLPDTAYDDSLGLTAATPGQIIKVKTVQDGKPTEWEAVDDRLPKVSSSDAGNVLGVEQIGEHEYGYALTHMPTLNDFIPLGITNASPGQFAKVSFVDDFGGPTAWEAADIYEKPTSGIPKSDLEQSVQTSLDKADTAISYDSQTLTEAQQKQARTNIGAGQPLFVVNVTTTLSEQGGEVYTADKTAAEIETAYQEGCEIVCRMSVPIIGMGFVPVQLPLASRRGRQIFMFAINQTMWTDKSSRIVSYLVTIADDGVNVGQNNTEIYIKPTSGIPKTDLEQSVQTSLNKADAAISLGLTATTPGQIIKVKTVQDGKPTEWEAVDLDAEKLPKFTKLLTHTITEDELAASPIAFVWGTAQIPNLNDFNVFVLSLVRTDGATIEFNKWVKLKINSKILGNICGTKTAASPQYTITANRLFGFWISGNYYDPRNIGVPVLVPPRSSSTYQSDLPDSEPVTSIGFTSYAADYGLTAGIVVEIWGAK